MDLFQTIQDRILPEPHLPFVYFLIFVFIWIAVTNLCRISKEIANQPRIVGQRKSKGEKKIEANERIWTEIENIKRVFRWKLLGWSFLLWCDIYVAFADLSVDISKIPFSTALFAITFLSLLTHILLSVVILEYLRRDDALPPH